MNSVIKKSSMKWSNRDQPSQNCPSSSSLFCPFLTFYTFATLFRGLLLELSWGPTPPIHFLKIIQIPFLELSGTLWLHCACKYLYSGIAVFPQTQIFKFFFLLKVLPVRCSVFAWNQLHSAFTSYIIYLLSLITIGFVTVVLIILLLLSYWCFIIWCLLLACRVQD